MEFAELMGQLTALSEEDYRVFQAKLLADDRIPLLGVRLPRLRRLAGQYRGEWETLLSFPDACYEVTMLKCLTLGMQDYDVFISHLPGLLPHIDNWAVCDSFTAPCIRKELPAFAEEVRRYRFSSHPFTSRFALVQLLRYYCREEEYLPLVFESAEGCFHEEYYVSMAAAWLLAETLVFHYGEAVSFLKQGTLPVITHNRAIRKARESFRFSPEQKAELSALKRK